jgi:AAA15 family ATPase/GTPase
MRLTYFTVSNYRSITTAYKLELKGVTVLIGKNNEGKSNLINALNLAMEKIHYVGYYQKKLLPPRRYNW